MEKQLLHSGFIILLFFIVVSMSAKAEAYVRPKPSEIILNCDRHKNDDLISLACNMYWEANTQGVKGMLAVAAVTLKRVQHPDYPNTIHEVVWQKHFIREKYRSQFSWTTDGRPDLVTIHGRKTWKKALKMARIFAVSAKQQPTCPEITATNKIWDYLDSIRKTKVKRHRVRCEAYDILMKSKTAIAEAMDPTGGALYYHADWMEKYPRWASRFEKTVHILNHIFYRPHTKNVAYNRK